MIFARNSYKPARTIGSAAIPFFLIATACLSLSRSSAAQATMPSVSAANDAPVINRWRDYTVLSKADQARLGGTSSVLLRRHTISDADLSFALKKLKSEPVVANGDNKLSLQGMVLTVLSGRKDFTPEQARKFLSAVTPYAYNANSSVAGCASLALGGLRDARVIPVLEQIAQRTTNQRVRNNALRNLPGLKELAAAGEI